MSARRAGFLLYLGGASGAVAALYFINIYSASEFICAKLAGGYSASMANGSTDIKFSGAD